jgi:predicted phosphodiesterase
MKYTIFSDTHLSKYFDEKKYNFLKKIISNSETIIINGDFWEAYNFKFDEFILSSWKKLFKDLKNKKTIYLFGNHDKKIYANNKLSEFSVRQFQNIKIISGSKTFYIEHGDKITPLWDKFFRRMPKFINIFLNNLEKMIVFLFGINVLKILYKRFNEDMKNKKSRILKDNEYLVCGHTHFMEIDKKNHYINGGFIKHGIGQYLTITDGKVELHNEKY